VSAPSVGSFLEEVAAWADSRPEVRAVALVGSHAAGRARPDSDVDLVVLADDPRRLLEDRAWLGAFGEWGEAAVEDWGALTSLRVRYGSGLEVEWGLGRPSWASTDPLDPGTARVAADALAAVYDPEGMLARLLMQVTGAPR
jgi:predicted nucleotidyltransferase